MDSFELNKIIGALLGVVFVVFSVSLISEAIFSTPAPETPGYAIVVPEDDGEAAGESEAAPESVLPLLASADPSAGENVFKRCQACHTAEQGGPNKVGPNLWGIVDRPVAGHEGFSYSGPMQEFSQGGSVVWTYENLDHFLTNPRSFVSGTAMAFAGLKNIEDRANVIAYLHTLSDNPAPLPEASQPEEGKEGTGEAAAPAEEGEEATAPAEEGEEGAGEATAPAEEGEEGTGEATAPAEDGAEATSEEGGEEAAPADDVSEPEEAAPEESTPEADAAGEPSPDENATGSEAQPDQEEAPAANEQ